MLSQYEALILIILVYYKLQFFIKMKMLSARIQKDDPRRKGRPETVSCAGTGAANCIFRWKRKGVVIDVNTDGETAPAITEATYRSGCS